MNNGKWFTSAKLMEEALHRLGKKMLYRGIEPVSLVVCGGSALNVLNIGERPTGDMDVLSLVKEENGELKLDRQRVLPDAFKEVIAETAADLGIPDTEWLNMGPSHVLNWGLPDGFMHRLEKREYGPCLTIYYASRLDQIHFKLLASLDPKEGERHFRDLTEFYAPTSAELKKAVDWLLGRNQSQAMKEGLKNIITGLGYDDLADRIQA